MSGGSNGSLASITLWGKVRSTRGSALFLALSALAVVAILTGTSHVLRLLSATDIGFVTTLSNRHDQRVMSASPRWPGLKPNDHIVSINGVPTDSVQSFWDARLAAPPGDVVVELIRDGQHVTERGLALAAATRPVLQQLAMALRLLAGGLLLLISVASFLIRPGSTISWLHFGFTYSLGLLMTVLAGEASRAYAWVYLTSIPVLVAVGTFGIFLFSTFPTPVFSERARSRWWWLVVVSVVLVTAYVLTYNDERRAIGDVVEIMCRAYPAILSMPVFFVLARGSREARTAPGQAGAKLRSLYRVIMWGAVFGLGIPVVGSLAVSVMGGDPTLLEAMIAPTFLFAASVALALVRNNSLNADKYTASVLGYSLTIAALSTGAVLIIVGLPWLLRVLDVQRASEVMVGVSVAAIFSAGRISAAIREQTNRWFKRTQADAREQAVVIRDLIERVSNSNADDAFAAVLKTALTIGADRAELWLLDHRNNTLILSSRSGELSAAELASAMSQEVPLTSPLGIALSRGPGGVAALAPTAYDENAQSDLWARELAFAVPVKAHGRLAGALVVGRKNTGFKYTADDLSFLQTVALQVTVTIERGDAVQKVGRYRIERRLNVGGTAEVFLASQLGPGGFQKRVALKRLLPDLAQDHRAAAMLFDEARIAARLHHANIVEVYEVGGQESSAFIAMELVLGRSVRQLIAAGHEQQRFIPVPICMAVASSMLKALHYAHTLRDEFGVALNIVHRDATPANVMVTDDGIVKLLDFGIATGGERLYRTATGLVRGTLPYMSPEQTRGEPVDARSDVFTAAATIYELLTLGRSFPRGPAELRFANVSSWRPELSDVDAVFEKAFQLEPNARYQTAEALLLALEHALGPHENEAGVKRWLSTLEPVSRAVPSERPASSGEARNVDVARSAEEPANGMHSKTNNAVAADETITRNDRSNG